MSKQDGLNEAIKLASAQLAGIDIAGRCENLGLHKPQNEKIELKVFSENMIFDINDFSLILENGKSAKPADLILLLHYFLSEFSVKETGELISFRELPSGKFYLDPFLSRTVNPLLQVINNNVEKLKNNLAKFDWEEIKMGDFAAKIHAFGNLYITVVYHCADDEFPASFDVFFDKCVKRAFTETEDAVVMASRICIGLLF